MDGRPGRDGTRAGQSTASGRTVTASGLRAAFVGVVCGLVLLGGLLYVGGANPLSSPTGEQPAANSSDEATPELNTTLAERAITEAVNHERATRGLEPVEHDDAIAVVARNHSRDMVEREYYAHESPDGEAPFERIEAGPPSCGAVGENIAATWWQKPFESTDGERDRHTTVEELADGLTEQWLGSESHRENMLDRRWDRTGVGVAVTADGEVLVTQNFCG
jgi:uncharacterized protein YkwD